MTKEIVEKLLKIQKGLKVPKNQRNTFGNYNYRNCEDILEAVKPLAHKEGCVVIIKDEIAHQLHEERFYVKSTAILTDGENSVEVTAYAREALSKKGMGEAQITGAASSYARKYALNGLFAIDDTKDADTQDTTATTETQKTSSPKETTSTRTKPASESQRKMYFAIAKSAGYTSAQAKVLAKKAFNLESFTDVSVKQCNTMINTMQSRVTKEKEVEDDMDKLLDELPDITFDEDGGKEYD